MFTATSWLITLMAAGMASQAVGFLQQSGLVTLWQEPLWDTSGILAQSSLAGRVLHTLAGYTDQPDGLQLLAWIATIAVIWTLGRIINGSVEPWPALRRRCAEHLEIPEVELFRGSES